MAPDHGPPLATEQAGTDDQAVRVRGLVKHYGGLRAVDGIDLDIARGEILALLGPNGAGKTTTVEILEGYRTRDAGEVKVLGFDPGHQRGALKSHIGIVLQSTGVERYLTVGETLRMYAGLYPHARSIGEVLELSGLTATANQRVLRLSGGQQRRLDMAIALVGDPDLLFLDEPTTGFDPSARHEAWDVVRGLASLGKTVLLTTHFMDEAEHLANRVVVIARGRIVAQGPPSTLGLRKDAGAVARFRCDDGVPLPSEWSLSLRTDGFREMTLQDPVGDLHRLLHWALDNGVELEGLEVVRPTLEDVYLALTESADDDEGPTRGKGETR